VLTYSGARGVVIDLWDSGIQVESPAEVAQVLLNPDAPLAASPTPDAPVNTTGNTGNNGVVVIPSVTPVATAVIENPTLPPATPSDTDTGTDSGAVTATSLPTETPQPQPETTSSTGTDNQEQFVWSDPYSLNILLMGIDQRAEGFDVERAHRTDTMIVLHVDPVNRSAAMISFPRDLWVDIPDYEMGRINQANYIGDLNAYPGGGGPALAMETIRANFGIDVDYYVMVNFTVFESVVDLIAPTGIEICVEQYIRDDRYPDAGFGTITIEFQPGCQNLSGERLLQYARTRRTENSDIDRARRQQQVLFALRNHVVSTGGVQSIVAQAVPLWNELSGSYRTNLTLVELRQLASLVDDISTEDIQTAVLGPPDYSEPATNAENDQILIPYTGRINQLIGQMFYGASADTNSNLQSLAAQEGAAVRVFNATNIAGLAGRTRTWLTSKGVSVSEIGNASTNVSQTVIRNYGGGRNTALWLADMMGLPPSRVQPGSDGLVASGVAVILGSDADSIISAP
jgi:LCP family protein required for cell wall assembly